MNALKEQVRDKYALAKPTHGNMKEKTLVATWEPFDSCQFWFWPILNFWAAGIGTPQDQDQGNIILVQPEIVQRSSCILDIDGNVGVTALAVSADA